MVGRSTQLIAACALVTTFVMTFVTTNVFAGPWKAVGNWGIEVDTARNNGCFMWTSYDGPAFLRFGFDRRDNINYVMFGAAAWKSLEVGKDYPLELQFDEEPPRSTTARAIAASDSSKALVVALQNFDVLMGMIRKQSLTIHYQGKAIQKLSMSGSYDAVQEMIRCQNYTDGNAAAAADPFTSRPSSGPANPFTPGQ